MYDHIIVRYGEIALKGKNRKGFVNSLKKRVKQVTTDFQGIIVTQSFDRMVVKLNGHDPDPVLAKLKTVFGIQKLSVAIRTDHDLEEIKEKSLELIRDQQKNGIKTFKVTVKRPYKQFPHRSQDMNREIGGYVLRNTEDLTVDVHNPDSELRVEIKSDGAFISCDHSEGAGGLPTNHDNKVMLMLSGGIDSPVAGYLTMKRGVKVEAVHFHSPPFTSERSRQKVEDLTRVLAQYGGDIRLHIVPFTNTQKTIQKEMPDNYSMTIMRRMMMRITERIAEQTGALAITTGESLGQVASQTIQSMNTINEVTNYPVLRPLISMDKVDIMNISRAIDTYDISIRPYEDCCTVFLPEAPKTRPKREHANKFEKYLPVDELVEEAVAGVETIIIKEKEEEFNDLL
ncbi:tRNA uracil 4-sulfurtransferase ThiI [Guptibacillus algicola]|uniref:tRNA uracil 4-sulfurtransferase ThiI n=1 Tax=Guptibacillus algicola TaxID=225844 RepID=UPI001CD7F5DA|nr:tRNA uracil 4-sulfurtransferase ThiI [Alkalihalobacillus algicola]MCA0986369.1 tRNA 4-thiouridine(8) synthase ThiI [Alkalihalobacillus algicola]